MMDNELMDICPYDPSHQVSRSRMPYHLMKCGKNHANVKKKICPYDTRHLVDPKDYDNHIKVCDAREYHVRNQNALKVEKEVESQGIPIPSFITETSNSQRWDSDEGSPSVLQSIQYKESQNLQYSAPKIGVSKNERRKHRFRQRLESQKSETFNQKENDCPDTKQFVQNNRTFSSSSNSSVDWETTTEEIKPDETFSRPPAKIEPETLNISGLTIKNKNPANSTQSSNKQDSSIKSDSNSKSCTFSYAKALGSRSASNASSSATNLNPLMNGNNGLRKRYQNGNKATETDLNLKW